MVAELAADRRSSELPFIASRPGRSASRVWSGIWPTIGAVLITVVIWQLVVWSGWRSQSELPGPWSVLAQLGSDLRRAEFYAAVGVTLRRAAIGYAIAATAGFVVAVLIARVRILRRAVVSLLVGLQSMPSIAWFPLAVVLLERSEGAVTLVVLLGAAPAIAAGLLAGIDQVHPQLIRVGRTMGADGM